MRPTVVRFVLLVLVASVPTGAASAGPEPVSDGHAADVAPGPTIADSTADPPWPNNETTSNNSTSPGQQLAGVVGAQGAAVEGELWNRTLAERLANATTAAERAALLANETETIGSYVDSLETVRENLTTAWEREELSAGEYRASLVAFVVRSRMVERRANQTGRAATELPAAMRDAYGLDLDTVDDLSDRAHDLYQFEERVAADVVNETLATIDETLADEGGERSDERAWRNESEKETQDDETESSALETSAVGRTLLAAIPGVSTGTARSPAGAVFR